MFLLNQSSCAPTSTGAFIFTFHYVSIKSICQQYNLSRNLYLHSTMFLLNLMQRLNLPCIQQNLHSTMFLLNHKPMQRVELFPKDLHSTMFLLNPKYSAIFPNLSSFTFHYVSIKSPVKFFMRSFVPLFTFHYVSIKSKKTSK